MIKKKYIITIFTLIFLFSSCNAEGKDYELLIYSPHPVEFIDPIINEFERSTDIRVNVVRAGTGELLSKIEAEMEQNKYSCDVLWGGSFATINNKKDLFYEYHSVNEEYLNYDKKDDYVTGFSFMPSVIMLNNNLLGTETIDSYQDLLDKDLKGKIAFANPSLSASSYEQLVNMIWAMGEGDVEKGWIYIEKLIDNLDGTLLDSSSKVYNGVAQGEYAVGLTFEEGAANFAGTNTPISLVYPKEGTIIRRDGICIIKEAKNQKEAEAFVDFLSGKDIQTFISQSLNRRSIRTDVEKSPNLIDLSEINIIKDDENWSFKNKDKILERFLHLFNEANDGKK